MIDQGFIVFENWVLLAESRIPNMTVWGVKVGNMKLLKVLD